jgi:hypothetical protein
MGDLAFARDDDLPARQSAIVDILLEVIVNASEPPGIEARLGRCDCSLNSSDSHRLMMAGELRRPATLGAVVEEPGGSGSGGSGVATATDESSNSAPTNQECAEEHGCDDHE